MKKRLRKTVYHPKGIESGGIISWNKNQNREEMTVTTAVTTAVLTSLKSSMRSA